MPNSPFVQGGLMSTTTEVDALHQLIGDLRRCVTSLVSTYGDTPVTRRIVNDAERILNGIDRLDIDVEELEIDAWAHSNQGVRRDDPDPGHPVPHRFLAGCRRRRHRRAERRVRANVAHPETQIGILPAERGGCRSALFPVAGRAPSLWVGQTRRTEIELRGPYGEVTNGPHPCLPLIGAVAMSPLGPAVSISMVKRPPSRGLPVQRSPFPV